MKYEINNGTLAIVPTDNNSSLVYEDDTRYMISEKPYQIMEVLMREERRVQKQC